MRSQRPALLAALVGLVALASRAQDPGPAGPGQADPAAVASPTGAAVASPTGAAVASPTGAAVASPSGAGAPVASFVYTRGLELRGMGVPLYGMEPDEAALKTLDDLAPVGVTHVLLFVHLWQADVGSPGPARHPLRTPADDTIRLAILEARQRGLEVALIPLVDLERADVGEWRGALEPPSWERWFAAYRRELLHWARLAEDAGVSLLAVGGGASSAEAHADAWRRLIGDVRQEFSGELTYSANWDRYAEVPFWSALDYIGISGYFELTAQPASGEDPKPEALRAAWDEQRRALVQWRARRGLRAPLLFTELGYPSVDDCAHHPWDYVRVDRPDLDLEEQALCYQAFVDAWKGAPELAGVFFYEWAGPGGSSDRGFTPRGKPALDIVRAYFGGVEAKKE